MAFHGFGAKALDAAAAIASLFGYLPIGSTDMADSSVSTTDVAHLWQAMSPEQRDYVQMRAGFHDMTGFDILLQVPKSVVDNPNEADELLHQTEISHILPQLTHPHLSSDPNNIVLEVARDYTNQARGANPMSPEDLNRVNERLNDVAFDIDHASDGIDIGDMLGNLQSHPNLVPATLAGLSRLTPVHFKRLQRLLHQIMVHGPRLLCSRDREQLLDAIQTFIAENLDDENSWAALLMGILVLKCPWALALLATRGLCSLAKAGCAFLDHLLNKLPNAPVLTQLKQFLGASLKALGLLFDLADQILSGVIACIDQGCRFAGRLIVAVGKFVKAAIKPVLDVVAATVKSAVALVQNVYKGATNAFNSFCRWIFGGWQPA